MAPDATSISVILLISFLLIEICCCPASRDLSPRPRILPVGMSAMPMHEDVHERAGKKEEPREGRKQEPRPLRRPAPKGDSRRAPRRRRSAARSGDRFSPDSSVRCSSSTSPSQARMHCGFPCRDCAAERRGSAAQRAAAFVATIRCRRADVESVKLREWAEACGAAGPSQARCRSGQDPVQRIRRRNERMSDRNGEGKATGVGGALRMTPGNTAIRQIKDNVACSYCRLTGGATSGGRLRAGPRESASSSSDTTATSPVIARLVRSAMYSRTIPGWGHCIDAKRNAEMRTKLDLDQTVASTLPRGFSSLRHSDPSTPGPSAIGPEGRGKPG
jgi:hypothetical protein